MNRIEAARTAAFATKNTLEAARAAFEAAEVAHAAAMVELNTAKAEAAAAPATETTVYPTKVGRAQTIHAAGFIGGDFQVVDFGYTACGTRSGSFNANTSRKASSPVAITCTKCLKVDAARRR